MKKKNMWISDTGDGSYRNPVLFADYSDPDVIRVGNDFYMVSSSFANVPAIPVLHSKDLVNWKVINYVCDRIPFDYYDNPCHGSGIWAPSIRFHDGLFYVCFPMPDEGIFMSTTIDPYEKWSEPVCIKKVKGWIDPCPFWDDDGKAYLVNAFSNGRIGIHSKLQMTQMSADGMSLIGESKIVFDGILRQPIIEGPKLYKRNGYYYIFAPAGTVKTGWETVLRSDNIWGPYEDRIALIQGGSTINGPHQGGVVDTANGEYWMLHFQHIEHVGRVVHLQPVVWEEDNWPTIGKKKWKGLGVPYTSHTKPDLDGDGIYAPDDSDSFDKPKLGLQWQWNANPKKEWYELDMRTQQLRLTSKPA